MLFSILFFLLEILVVSEGWLAYGRGFFSRSQGKTSLKKIGYFIENPGFWGDFFIISPLVAYLVFKYSPLWSAGAIAISLAFSAALAGFMANQWRLASHNLDDPFNENGKILFAGWLHYGYMVIAFSTLLLYYFATSHENAREHAGLVTGIFCFHSLIGFLVPPLTTYGKVSKNDLMMVAGLVAFLVLGYLKIAFH